jgi:hypothetical protein
MAARSSRNTRSKGGSRAKSSSSVRRSSGSRSRSRSSKSTSKRSSSARSASARGASARGRRTAASSRSRAASGRKQTAGRTSASRSTAASRPLTDHDEILQWAEERNASPACVRGTGGGEDIGMIRLDFPGYSGERSLEHIEWDEWFQKFDDSGLALLVQDRTARGQKSSFNKLVSRQTAAGAGRGRSSARRSSGHGETGSRKRAA